MQCQSQLTCGYLKDDYISQGCCNKTKDEVLPPEIDISGYGHCTVIKNGDHDSISTEIHVSRGWEWTQYPAPVMVKDASPEDYNLFVDRNLVLWTDQGPDGIFSTTVESVNSTTPHIIIKLANPIVGSRDQELPDDTTCHFTLDAAYVEK